MTKKNQTNYEQIANELYARLVDMAHECSSLAIEVSDPMNDMSQCRHLIILFS